MNRTKMLYRSRASFFNATARTADGFVGLIFRREPTFKFPENSAGVGRALAAFAEDADMQGRFLRRRHGWSHAKAQGEEQTVK
jgi:hypothetical protein